MASLHIAIVQEPAFENSIWSEAYMKGISMESASQGIKKENDKDAVTLLIGSTPSWLLETGEEFRRQEKQVVLIGPDIPEADGLSSVAIDYQDAMGTIMSYFRQYHRSKSALLGVNPSSLSDNTKRIWYERNVTEGNMYPNDGNAEACCRRFLSDRNHFDSVICCTDFIAITLLLELRKTMDCKVPEDLWLISFGDTTLGTLWKPSLSSFTCDYRQVGRLAVKMAMSLGKNKEIHKASWTTCGKLLIRETTASSPFLASDESKTESAPHSADVFYQDKTISRIQVAEQLFSHLDTQDFHILQGLQEKSRYEDLADRCNMSENTLKYRIKRMESLSKTTTRDCLLEFVEPYLIP